MPVLNLILLMLGGGVVMLALMLSIVFVQQRRAAARTPSQRTTKPVADSPEVVPRPPESGDELSQRVQQILAREASLQGLNLELRTAPNGSLEIWLNARRYSTIDDIPNPRVREAVRQALAELKR